MEACLRPGCPFHHSASPRRHGFCCNACRRGEEGHTSNCSGQHRHPVMPVAHQAFQIPGNWACAIGGIPQYIGWHMNRLGYDMPIETRAAWGNLQAMMAFIKQDRPLTIYVLAEDSASPMLNNMVTCVNVHTRGLDAYAPRLYNLKDVTGIDFNVQAVLISQPLTAEVLIDACRFIELQELDTFAFKCKHATHRSCGCAVLLASLVYQRARIVFSTHRTKQAARQRGMIEEDVDAPSL